MKPITEYKDYYSLIKDFYEDQKDDESKMPYWKEMRRIALEYKVRVVDKEAVEYFDGWKNQVVRELAPMMPGATPGQIAKTCCNEITAAEVSKSLEFLTKAGFLKKGADGSYRQTEKNVAASKEGMAYAVHAMQHKMLQLADESIERFEPQERSVSSVTFTVNRECYERIVQEIDSFRRKIAAMPSEIEKADQIYHLNMQLFPLTWKLNKDEDK